MRPLLIISEARQANQISEVIRRYGHPQAISRFIRRIEVDLNLEVNPQHFHYEIMKVLQDQMPAGARQGYLICATHDIERELRLKGFLKTQQAEFQLYNAQELAKVFPAGGQAKPQLAKIIANCGLSIDAAALSIISNWTHSLIDINALTAWKGQFGRLGKLSWLADAILARVALMTAPELGEIFMNSPVMDAEIAAYNKDRRGAVKSGDILANLLNKRRPDLELLDSPADAIAKFPNGNVVVVEDGLWSGTELIGVFDSLLGRRAGREKTKPLDDPSLLKGVSLTLVFGMSTDYGEAMVRRYLQDEGLNNISIFSASPLELASPTLLTKIGDPAFPIDGLRANGPMAGDINPFLISSLSSALTPDQCENARLFCNSLGRQLWVNYLTQMKTLKDWDMWPDEKLDNCALGMHGLGLTHAFGHSVPKASLPLLWGSGPVQWGGKTIEWKPLFKNA
ncbi:phosphoribosyltransferase-like protein [Pseudomonas pergaminensis]